MKRGGASTLSLLLCMGTGHAALAQQASAQSPAAPVASPTTTPAPQITAATPAGNAGGVMNQSATSPPTAGGSTLTEVVVTAQRRLENLQKVPISVSAISAAKLQAANITSSADLAAVTPALTFSNVNGYLQSRIRGIGNASQGPSIENSVATYIDGVYLASAPGSLQNLNNIQQVEVLDGPQGTLFGRNATGGLIQILTKDPKSTFGGNADVSYENYDTTRLAAYLTGPVFGPVDADLALYASHQGDGYGTQLFNDKPTDKTDRDIAARSKWLARFDTGTTVRLSFDFENTSTSDPSLNPVGDFQSAFGPRSPAVQAAVDNNRYDENDNDLTVHRLIAGGTSGRIDQELGPLVLTDIAAYRKTRFSNEFDADGVPAQIVQELFTEKDEQVSEEIQLAPRHTGKLQWIVGVYYFHLDSAYDPLTLRVGPTESDQRNAYVTESVAPYAQATYEILPETHVTGGFRYTYERRTQTGATTDLSATGAATVIPIADASLYSDTPTWRLAVDHSFNSNLLGYISWNRGFKSGGFNPSVPSQPAYKPERLDDYEIGEKSTLFAGRLRLNAAFFYYIYKDIQVNTYIGSESVTLNGAEAREYGLDATFDLSLTRDLTLTGGAVLLHDRFTDFPLTAVGTLNAANDTTPIVQGSATGNRLPFAPDATLNLGVDYKHQVLGGQADLFVNDLYDTGYYGQADNFLHQGAFHLLNASLQYQPDQSPLTFKLYAKNITNAGVAEFLSVTSVGSVASYEPPTTYGFTVGYKF